MSDQHEDRAERAFRAAFAARGDDAPHEPLDVPDGPRRHAWWVAGAAAAAVVAAVAIPLALLGGDDAAGPDPTPATSGTDMPAGTRWVSYRGVEVAVPVGWDYDYGPVLPECIEADGDYRKDPWAQGTPTGPYVEVEPALRVVPSILCQIRDRAGRGPREFGDLPVDLWRPHVLLETGGGEAEQGGWTYQGWTLVRQTVGAVSITVLTAPGDEGLAEEILATAREVGMDENGCPATSDVQATEFVRPSAGTVPRTDFEGVVALCQYLRGNPREPGLVASRQLSNVEARDLIGAIRAAPSGGGPDQPRNCAHDMYGDLAIVVRFLPAGWVKRDVYYPEAFVYYDWCFGNGIFDAEGAHRLTRENCRPLFAEAPLRYWGGSAPGAELCWSR